MHPCINRIYSETRLLRTPKGKEKEYVLTKYVLSECDLSKVLSAMFVNWKSERYNRVYVLTCVRTNRVSLCVVYALTPAHQPVYATKH